MSIEKPCYDPKSYWVVDVVEFLLDCAFVCLIVLNLKDWFFFRSNPYPYSPSFITTLGVLAGFVCFLRVRRFGAWRNILLAGSTLFITAEISGLVLQKGSMASLSALVCGLATPPLFYSFTAKQRFERKHFWYLGAFLIAAATLIYRASASQNLVWGVLVVLMATGTSTLAALITRSGHAHRSASEPTLWKHPLALSVGSFLLFGGLLSLVGSTILPVNLPAAARMNVWQGEGFGQNTFPAFWPGAASFAPVIAQEQGMFALWVLVLVFGAALCAGALVVWNRPPDGDNLEEVEQRQARVELGCGALESVAVVTAMGQTGGYATSPQTCLSQ